MSRKSSIILAVAAVSASLTASAHAGKLVISEVLYNEVGSSFTGEWIEIYNGSDTAIDLSNYKTGDEETKGQTSTTEAMYQFPAGSSIAPGQVQIVSSFASRFKEVYGFAPTYEFGSQTPADAWVDDAAVPNMTQYAAWDPDGAKLNMSNSNDQALILDGSDNLVDGVAWGSAFYFSPGLAADAGDGQSLQRIDPNVDTDTAADWANTTAAPAGAFWTTKSNPGTLPPTAATWASDGDGAWIINSNWQDGNVPNAAGFTVVFGGAITAPRTVTLLQDETVGTLKFNSTSAYTLEGPGKLTLNTVTGPALVQVLAGNHAINAPVTLATATTFDIASGSSLSLTGTVTSDTVAITKTSAGTLTMNRVRAASLAINGGVVAIAGVRSDAGTSVIGALTIAAGASLDLGNNAIVLDYATTSPLGSAAAAINAGLITSSAMLTNPRLAIATADTATFTSLTTFGGVALDSTAVVARVALKGDSNISGTVDFADLVVLAQNYNVQTGATWTTGDSNYDGKVDFADLVSLAQNYNATETLAGLNASPTFLADWNLARSLVPEPTVCLSLMLAAPMIRRRRR